MAASFALLVTALDGRRFAEHLAHSFAIATVCWLVAEGTHGTLDRLRAALGVPADAVRPRALVDLAIATALATVAGPVMGTALVDWLAGHQVPSLSRWSDGMVRLSFALAALGTLATLSAALLAERAAREATLARRAQREAAEFRLRLLESQLEPHMLFNTLAHLHALIDEDPRAAHGALDRLISFFDATLRGSRSGEHALRDEAARIADYLAIIRMRMGPRLTCRVTLPPELEDLRVPALIVQPLVENAVKHGIEPKVGPGTIELVASRRGDVLTIDVRDTGDGLDVQRPAHPLGTGFGIEQVRARLKAVHGDRASLSFLPAEPPTVADGLGGVVARLELPVEPADRSAPRTESC